MARASWAIAASAGLRPATPEPGETRVECRGASRTNCSMIPWRATAPTSRRPPSVIPQERMDRDGMAPAASGYPWTHGSAWGEVPMAFQEVANVDDVEIGGTMLVEL